ncbi:hypothetical protein ACFW1M_27910 [Streptomyces inhibens]|uniref:hypothetical protein n=1 Tax=Streptomyces inhibens TaxID=2293571 RepID=UPI0036C61073
MDARDVGRPLDPYGLRVAVRQRRRFQIRPRRQRRVYGGRSTADILSGLPQPGTQPDLCRGDALRGEFNRAFPPGRQPVPIRAAGDGSASGAQQQGRLGTLVSLSRYGRVCAMCAVVCQATMPRAALSNC